ncbi:hypothetical protein [Lentilactobacillus hilgardii]|uniref:hypothetical protein n=2 Tax=Lentilactobacillus hilgardii TaxID=1588 RepID=UPI001CC2043C|nr:hypothetical protein [Lentilactobacillus hilgardii]MBZ2201743.1 hypothetical protein [Lentilactobacillus hilgardii]MBZ2204630.1 hypothetical protein [Lentilactobacillus hilgardii]
MKYSLLIEKDDLLKLRLLLFIRQQGDKAVFQDCLSNLNITQYKLRQLVNELDQTDLKGNDQLPLYIKISNNEVSCKKFQFLELRQLQLVFLQRSIYFHVFLRESFDKKGEPLSDFLSAHFISRAKYYQIRVKLYSLLDEVCDLAKSDVIRIPQELLKRIKFTNVFYHFFGGIEKPFPELSMVTSKFISMVTMTLNRPVMPNEISKLGMFFQVQLMRINMKKYVDVDHLFRKRDTDSMKIIDGFYQGAVSLLDKTQLNSEVTYLYFFMISQGLISENHLRYSNRVERYLMLGRKYYHLMLRRTHLLRTDYLTDSQIDRATKQLTSLSYWPIFFDFQTASMTMNDFVSSDEPAINQSSGSFTDLSESFPDLKILASKIAEYGLSLFHPNITQEFIGEVTYGVLTILVGVIPKAALIPVDICLGLDQDRASSGYISELLKKILPGNIHISSNITNATDICISNVCDFNPKDVLLIPNFKPFQIDSFIDLEKTVCQIKFKKLKKLSQNKARSLHNNVAETIKSGVDYQQEPRQLEEF